MLPDCIRQPPSAPIKLSEVGVFHRGDVDPAHAPPPPPRSGASRQAAGPAAAREADPTLLSGIPLWMCLGLWLLIEVLLLSLSWAGVPGRQASGSIALNQGMWICMALRCRRCVRPRCHRPGCSTGPPQPHLCMTSRAATIHTVAPPGVQDLVKTYVSDGTSSIVPDYSYQQDPNHGWVYDMNPRMTPQEQVQLWEMLVQKPVGVLSQRCRPARL